MLVRMAKWSWLKAWAMKIATRHMRAVLQAQIMAEASKRNGKPVGPLAAFARTFDGHTILCTQIESVRQAQI